MIDTQVVPLVFLIILGTCSSIVVTILMFYYVWDTIMEKEEEIMKRVDDED